MTPDPIVRPGKAVGARPRPRPQAKTGGLLTKSVPNRPIGMLTKTEYEDDPILRPAETEAESVTSPLLDREETARYLKISIDMVDKLRGESQLRGTKIGNRVLYKIDLLNEFIDLNTDPPPSTGHLPPGPDSSDLGA